MYGIRDVSGANKGKSDGRAVKAATCGEAGRNSGRNLGMAVTWTGALWTATGTIDAPPE
ncbi:hypothetical protein [uncultured Ruegeria sp.]|uniref:hypothetical protein n=1 Tax=uncultured Ruegeria sp. TaxID=259304 RepID=UPI00342E46B6